MYLEFLSPPRMRLYQGKEEGHEAKRSPTDEENNFCSEKGEQKKKRQRRRNIKT